MRERYSCRHPPSIVSGFTGSTRLCSSARSLAAGTMSGAGNSQDGMQGLLRFCLQATQSEDGTTAPAMDQERRAFLQQVLAQMATDPLDELRKAMTIVSETLNHVPQDVSEDAEVVVQIEKIVDDVILDTVSSLDYANDFYKLGQCLT